MVAGLKFLSKKGFNPQNLSNQKRVWEREQETKLEAKRIQERQQQLQRERDDEELALARGDTPRLKFLYDVPSHSTNNTNDQTDDDPIRSNSYEANVLPDVTSSQHSAASALLSSSSILPSSLIQRQPGDDDAAAEFRKMLAAAAAAAAVGDDEIADDDTNEDHEHSRVENLRHPSFSTVLQGSSAERISNREKDAQKKQQYALEKAVGKKQSVNTVVTLEEQIERFPALKNAPRAKGMTATDVGVSFKPLGAQIRNIKCLVCGIWGHSKGDRECPESGWDPFAIPSKSLLSKPTSTIRKEEEDHTSFDEKTRKTPTTSFQETKVEHHRDVAHRKRKVDNDSEVSDSDDSSSYERRKRKRKKEKKKRKDKKKKKHKSSRTEKSRILDDNDDKKEDYDDDEKMKHKRNNRSENKNRRSYQNDTNTFYDD